MKEGFYIVRITSEEAEYLKSKGVPMGENGISRPVSKLNYYLTESKKNMAMLNKYRNSKVVERKSRS